MSYCRWSSNDFRCDVYVYEDCRGGWTTHVAGRRRVFTEPIPDSIPFGEEGYWERYEKVMGMVEEARLEPIGLPHDGETFNDETPGEAATTLIMLRDAGYIVPGYAIDALLEEAE